MLKNQFNRRNLTDFIRGELALSLKSRLREQAVESSFSNNRYMQATEKECHNDCQNFDSRKNEQGCEKDHKDWNESRVDAQVGRLAGISREQVRKIEKLKETSNDQELQALRTGKVSIHKAYRKNGFRATFRTVGLQGPKSTYPRSLVTESCENLESGKALECVAKTGPYNESTDPTLRIHSILLLKKSVVNCDIFP